MHLFLIYTKDSIEDTVWTLKYIRTEFLPVIGPVDLQHHPTDQYIDVQCSREFATIIPENQASLVELQEESVMFLAKEKKKRSKQVSQSVITPTKCGHMKAIAEPASIPVEMAIPLEERIHDQTSPSSL